MGKNKILLYSKFSCSHRVKLSSTFAPTVAPLDVGANVFEFSLQTRNGTIF